MLPRKTKEKEVRAPEQVFVRRASGLVRELDLRHILIFNILMAAFFGGTWFAFTFNPVVFPEGNFLLGLLIAVALCVPFYLTYSFMLSAYPRTGGDYIIQTRVIHPALGFASAMTSWVIWQWWWNVFYGYGVTQIYLGPGLDALGRSLGSKALVDASSWVISGAGLWFFSFFVLAFAAIVLVGGLRVWIKIQWILFIFSIIGIASGLIIFFTTSQSAFIANFNKAMAPMTGNPDSYQLIRDTAASLGAGAGSAGGGISLFQSIGMMILPISTSFAWIAYPHFFMPGEVRGAEKFGVHSKAMIGSLIANAVFWALFWIGLNSMAGSGFWTDVSTLTLSYDPNLAQWGVPAGAAYYPWVTMMGSGSPILTFLFLVGGAINSYFLVFGIFIATARVLFAMSFDRVLPAKVSWVHMRTRTPLVATLIMVIGSFIWQYFYLVAPGISFYFASAIVGTCITLAITTIGAMAFPFLQKTKATYRTSPPSAYKIKGIPWITICGAIGFIFVLIISYYLWSLPELGFFRVESIALVFGLWIGCIAYWYIARWYQRRRGIDVDLAYKEIPPA